MKNSYKPLIVAVFLVIGGGLASHAFLPQKTGLVEVRGVLGEPSSLSPASTIVGVARGAEVVNSAVVAENVATSLASGGAVPNDQPPAKNFASTGAVQDVGSPIGPVFDSSGAMVYTVKKGDNISQVASHFHVSAAGIMSANPSLHKKVLLAGASIIIPNGINAIVLASESSKPPNFNKDFVMPTQGYNYGILHNYNAVDIANLCGTAVTASAEGLVIPDENVPNVSGGWNAGYGTFVLIEHPFGNSIRTRYAHLEKILVQIGDYVKQGQKIGLMGESGESSGCHLHFEVIGAENPFAK